MPTPTQLSLTFEQGLTAHYRELEDCLRAAVDAYRGGVDAVAPALDMAPTELTRRLNAHTLSKEGDPSNRPLRVSDMVKIINKTRDYRPIFWMVEKFLRDPESQRTSAIHQLAALMPTIVNLVEQAAPAKGKAK